MGIGDEGRGEGVIMLEEWKTLRTRNNGMNESGQDQARILRCLQFQKETEEVGGEIKI